MTETHGENVRFSAISALLYFYYCTLGYFAYKVIQNN